MVATTEEWREFDNHHQAYKHNGGKKSITKLTDNLEYIAEYILDGTFEDLVKMSNAELRKMFYTYINADEATGYALDLSNLYMEKTTNIHLSF